MVDGRRGNGFGLEWRRSRKRGGDIMKVLSNTKWGHAVALLMFAAFLTFCVAPRLSAQVTGGSILGTVTDPTAATVPNVEVSITNTATGVVTTVTTNDAGFFSVPNLLPGPYQVTAKASGFSTAVVTGITLTVGAQQTVNIPLKVGETSQQVE